MPVPSHLKFDLIMDRDGELGTRLFSPQGGCYCLKIREDVPGNPVDLWAFFGGTETDDWRTITCETIYGAKFQLQARAGGYDVYTTEKSGAYTENGVIHGRWVPAMEAIVGYMGDA